MITGDKQETAINIAIACKLVHHPDSLIVINAADSNEAARARLEEALQHCSERHAAHVGLPPIFTSYLKGDREAIRSLEIMTRPVSCRLRRLLRWWWMGAR